MFKKIINKIESFFGKPKGPVSYCKKDENGDYYAYVSDQGGEHKVSGPYGSCKSCMDNSGADSCR